MLHIKQHHLNVQRTKAVLPARVRNCQHTVTAGYILGDPKG